MHISPGAVLDTEVLVADFIYGESTVKGNLHARHAVELSSSAVVKGSIRYDKHLDIHPGARLHGQMIGPESEK